MLPTQLHVTNATASVATIVDPTGVPANMEMMIPEKAQRTAKTAEQTVTPRKLLQSLMADNAGNTTKAEIKSDPTRFMASTMMTAVMTAINRL